MSDLSFSARVLMLESYPAHCPPQIAAVWREGFWSPKYHSTHHIRIFATRNEALEFLSNHTVEGGFRFRELLVDICHGHVTAMLAPTAILGRMPCNEVGEISYGDGEVTRLILDHLHDCHTEQPSESVLSD